MTALKAVYWDKQTIMPLDMSINQLLYTIRQSDAGLMLDSCGFEDIYEDADEVLGLDAMTTPYAYLERKMTAMKRVLNGQGDTLKVDDVAVSEPFTQNGVVNVVVRFALSDGQTISVYFHNPDTTPKKVLPTDEMISWKWLINKRDVTIVVAPEKGVDLDVRQVCIRIMRLAEKNSPAFLRANAKMADNKAKRQALQGEIAVLEGELATVTAELADLKADTEARKSNAVQDNIYSVSNTISQAINDITSIPIDESVVNEKYLEKIKTNIAKAEKYLLRATTERQKKTESKNVTKYQKILDDYLSTGKVDKGIMEDVKFTLQAEQHVKNKTMAESQQAQAQTEKHYSEKIIEALVENYGWEDKGNGYVAISDQGGIKGGSVNPRGERSFSANFDEGGRYLALYAGFNKVFDMDMRDKGLAGDIDGAAKDFDQMARAFLTKTYGEDPWLFEPARELLIKASDLMGKNPGMGVDKIDGVRREAGMVGAEAAANNIRSALKAGNLLAALKEIEALSTDETREALLRSGFAMAASAKNKKEIMAFVQGQMVDAARKKTDGYGVNAVKNEVKKASKDMDKIDGEMDALERLVGKDGFDDAMDALIEKITAAGVMDIYEPRLLELDRRNANAIAKGV